MIDRLFYSTSIIYLFVVMCWKNIQNKPNNLNDYHSIIIMFFNNFMHIYFN